jgi:hypothetical protein
MYGDMKNEGDFVEISITQVKKGMNLFVNEEWVKALEDSHVNKGYVGFVAEDADFKRKVIEVRKNDIAYAPRIKIEKAFAPADEKIE